MRSDQPVAMIRSRGYACRYGGREVSYSIRRRSVAPIGAALIVGAVLVAGPVSDASAGGHHPPAQNGRIAYSSGFILPDPDLGGSQVFTVNPNGSDSRQLTHVPEGTEAGAPAWSPDGTNILYSSNVSGSFQIWVMAADGSGQRPLVSDPDHDAFQPRWSPDGRHIVFARCTTPFGVTECNLAIVKSDGTRLHEITGGHFTDSAPDYSPDGRKIAFSSDRDGFQSAIWTVNTDGSGLHRLTKPVLEAFWPNWAPDGRHIVFTTYCCLPFTQVYVMKSNGKGVTALTHLPGNNQAALARYSPDGRKIVMWTGDPETSFGLSTMNADGSGLQAIVNRPAATTPDWGPR